MELSNLLSEAKNEEKELPTELFQFNGDGELQCVELSILLSEAKNEKKEQATELSQSQPQRSCRAQRAQTGSSSCSSGSCSSSRSSCRTSEPCCGSWRRPGFWRRLRWPKWRLRRPRWRLQRPRRPRSSLAKVWRRPSRPLRGGRQIFVKMLG